MKFNKTLWLRDSFSSKHRLPTWPCPACINGSLQKDKESITLLNTEATNKGLSLAYVGDAMAEFKFHGYLKCNECSERVVISGYGKYYHEDLEGHASAIFKGKRIPVYFPTHFQPELHMIMLPGSVDAQTKLLLIKSFGHFWYDLDACANKIRHALENLVTQRNGVGSNLHQKIDSLSKKLDSQIVDTMLALKHIGNDGSHLGREFTKDEILDAYALLEDLLNLLFPDTTEQDRRAQLVKTIIAKKGVKKL